MLIDVIKELGLSIRVYNALSTEEKYGLNRPFMYDPFDADIKNKPMVNPVNFKLINKWKDGVHYLVNPFNFNITNKIIVEDNQVIKAYKYDNETHNFKLCK